MKEFGELHEWYIFGRGSKLYFNILSEIYVANYILRTCYIISDHIRETSVH